MYGPAEGIADIGDNVKAVIIEADGRGNCIEMLKNTDK
jgi:hypothetical protein